MTQGIFIQGKLDDSQEECFTLSLSPLALSPSWQQPRSSLFSAETRDLAATGGRGTGFIPKELSSFDLSLVL